jgi:hypothetical protein
MVKRIGVLDGSKTFSMLMFVLLRRMGFEVTLFESLDQLEKASVEDIDLLFVGGDKTSGPSAEETIKYLKSIYGSSKKIIVVSTISDQRVVINAKIAGASGYIFKPIQIRSLHEAIAKNVIYDTGRRHNLRSSLGIKAKTNISEVYSIMPINSLSRGGLLLGTEGSMPPNTQVSVDLSFAGVRREVLGAVIYNRKNCYGAHSGTAVLFKGLSAREGDTIDGYLENDLILSVRRSVPSDKVMSAGFLFPRSSTP